MRHIAALATLVVAASACMAVSALAEQIRGVEVGETVLLKERTQTSGCTLGANPDLECSPGAYYSALTKSRICADSFRTGPIRNVPASVKRAVKIEYGLEPISFGAALEISLQLGGSNDIANLFPEKADANPGYHVKDKLENKLHHLVCKGKRQLRAVQRRIASDWQALYKSVFAVAPTD